VYIMVTVLVLTRVTILQMGSKLPKYIQTGN
jgi:hypothetical protein